MPNPEESDSILEPIDNSTDSATGEDAQRRSLQQSGKDVQVKLAQKSANFNIGEIKSERVHIGDSITTEYILGPKVTYISVDEIKTRGFNQTSPYKGLKKFEPEDKDRFFGRDQFIKDLADELEQTNLILLLGASGSGKSSVVRAGLIPWLQQSRGKHFVSLMFTPDRDPFESLYSSLLSRGYSQAQAQVARTGKVDTLSQVVNTLKPSETFWLLFIDQFEELFTVSEPEKRDCFIESLVKLSKTRAKDATLKIVATMRADFLDQLDPAPANGLARLTDKHRPLITQMQTDELQLAIEQPAAHHGVVFETDLVEEIIKGVQGQAGYLPLLQYTLDLLWEAEVQDEGILDRTRTLNTSSYRRLGGVRGALRQRVDQIYQEMPQPEQLATQRVFLRLVGIGGDEAAETEWKPIRRRANRSEFEDQLEKKVITRLVNENLLVSNRETQAQTSTIEIAHEVLLTSWTTLNTWIRENRLAIALRNRLNHDVELWKTRKASDELWSGSKLEQVLELKHDPTFNQVLGGFDQEANRFIDASMRKRNQQRYRAVTLWTGFSTLTLLSTILFISLGTPFIANIFNAWGFGDYRAKRFSSAVEKYSWAIRLRLGETNALIYYNRGLAYESLSDFSSAASDYKAAIAANPKFATSYNNLARLYILERKDYSEATKLLQYGLQLPAVQKLDAEDLDAYNSVKYFMLKNLGWAQFELKSYSAAKTNLMQATGIDGKRGAAYCLLAKVLEAQNAKTDVTVRNVKEDWENCIKFGDSSLPEEKEWMSLARKRLNS